MPRSWGSSSKRGRFHVLASGGGVALILWVTAPLAGCSSDDEAAGSSGNSGDASSSGGAAGNAGRGGSGNGRYLKLAFSQSGDVVTASIPTDKLRSVVGYYILYAMVDDIPSIGKMIRVIL